MTDTSASTTSQDLNDLAKAVSCEDFLHSKIRSANTISFSTFMADALYHETHGYYASESPRVGKKGDFMTSVSVGNVFGTILARRILEYWKQLNKPEDFCIVEMGANNAELCIDIVEELSHTTLADSFCYHIIEPQKQLRKKQQQALSQAQRKVVTIHQSIEAIGQTVGVFLSNELFDAFPVERIRYSDKKWHQLHVSSDGESFHEVWQPILVSTELHTFVDSLGTDFPDGYTTEYCPDVSDFLNPINTLLTTGLVITIDYGFPRSHFYDPSRIDGTLQTYYQHQKTNNPSRLIGEQDITAHVNFTQLASLFQHLGFKLFDFSPQHRYLTSHGKEWLIGLEKNFNAESVEFIKQFQTLTHPSMLGQHFHVLEMTKNSDLVALPTTPRPNEVLELP